MAGVDKNDQAMQRVLHKEGITEGPSQTQGIGTDLQLKFGNKGDKSGPGHSEQVRPFYKKPEQKIEGPTGTNPPKVD
ncbi:hypothetical protein SUGI_0447740 [Cryptomeria japonica]|nr:hypothetical protein SUGI_0447740 [Cryptomeria japonica]